MDELRCARLAAQHLGDAAITHLHRFHPNRLGATIRLRLRRVIVNGVDVVIDGKHTGAKPGRAVHGPGYQLP